MGWFGEPLNYKMFSTLPASVRAEIAAQRLEGKAFVATHTNQTYVHYLKLVTTTYKKPSRPDISLYKYSAHSNEYQESDGIPSVMIRYDLSPMSVVVTESHALVRLLHGGFLEGEPTFFSATCRFC